MAVNAGPEREAGWQAGLVRLRAEGWQAALTCASAPVQIEGRLPSGERFYFRARHDEVSLSVGGTDPAEVQDWERGERYPGASFLPAGDGFAILTRLAQRYAWARGVS